MCDIAREPSTFNTLLRLSGEYGESLNAWCTCFDMVVVGVVVLVVGMGEIGSDYYGSYNPPSACRVLYKIVYL